VPAPEQGTEVIGLVFDDSITELLIKCACSPPSYESTKILSESESQGGSSKSQPKKQNLPAATVAPLLKPW
jgi:hypothetical protein